MVPGKDKETGSTFYNREEKWDAAFGLLLLLSLFLTTVYTSMCAVGIGYIAQPYSCTLVKTI